MKFGKRLRKVVFVGGASGSGKTTLVRKLAGVGSIYEEKGLENPFLLAHLQGGALDAVRNQEWFFEQIENFLEEVDSEIAIVDQHPLAIGRAYTELFREKDLISSSAAQELSKRGHEIYRELESAGIISLTVHLLASSDILWSRILSRATPPKLSRADLGRVNEIMQGIVFEVRCLPVNSEVVSPEQEMERVLQWLEDR